MGLKTFGDVSSKWIFRNESRWEKCFAFYFSAKQIVHGSYVSEKTNVRMECDIVDRCLPKTAISIACIVVLLSRWASLSR